MNLVSFKQSETMSSRTMAELCEKRHDSVKRTIESLSDRSIIGLPQSVEYLDSLNRPAHEYLIGKRDSYIVVAQLSPEFTARLVDRWQELENQSAAQFKIPTTLHEALRLAADQSEALLIANEKLATAAPKVEYYEKVVEREHLLNASQVGQKVSMSAVIMNRHLDGLGVYNAAVKRSRVFQQWFIDKGYGELKQTDSGFPQAMFTLKGEAWIVQKFISEGLV
jgi:phage regulator Rha-like protein